MTKENKSIGTYDDAIDRLEFLISLRLPEELTLAGLGRPSKLKDKLNGSPMFCDESIAILVRGQAEGLWAKWESDERDWLTLAILFGEAAGSYPRFVQTLEATAKECGSLNNALRPLWAWIDQGQLQ